MPDRPAGLGDAGGGGPRHHAVPAGPTRSVVVRLRHGSAFGRASAAALVDRPCRRPVHHRICPGIVGLVSRDAAIGGRRVARRVVGPAGSRASHGQRGRQPGPSTRPLHAAVVGRRTAAHAGPPVSRNQRLSPVAVRGLPPVIPRATRSARRRGRSACQALRAPATPVGLLDSRGSPRDPVAPRVLERRGTTPIRVAGPADAPPDSQRRHSGVVAGFGRRPVR